MSNANVPVTVRILDKEYRVGCPADERESLLKASIYLNDKINDVKGNGKLVGGERAAIITALNIAHELLQLKENGGSPQTQTDDDAIHDQILQLQDKVERALHESRQLEF